MTLPRYPQIHVSIRSHNPLALVAAVRHELRRARVERAEIHRFTREALGSDDPRRLRSVCGAWVEVNAPGC